MRWKDARRSENIEDSRGSGATRGRGRGGTAVVGGGIGTIVVALIAIFVFDVDPQVLLNQGGGGVGVDGVDEPYVPKSLAEEEMADFTSTVLAYTEDVWDQLYPAASREFLGQAQPYVRPKLRIFSDYVQSACGNTSAAVGPFYCPADRKVYIDLSFFDELKRKFNAPGDFAQAYVVAHEVGHHVQNLLGISSMVNRKRASLSEEESNRLSVRQELQADYFAGVWAYHGQKQFQFLEEGDVEEGIRAAQGVGDDMIQKRSQGYVVEEAFTHGSAEQRIRWFTLGLRSGDPAAHNPFDAGYDDL